MLSVALRGLDWASSALLGRSTPSERSAASNDARAPTAQRRGGHHAATSKAAHGANPASIWGSTPGLSSGAVLGMPPKAQVQEKQVQQQEIVVPLDDRERLAFQQEARTRAHFDHEIHGGDGGASATASARPRRLPTYEEL